MLMFDRNIKIREHGHIAEFYPLLLRELLAMYLPIPININQRGLNRLNRFIMPLQLTQHHTLINIRGGYSLKGILIVLLQQALLDLQGNVHRLERILILFIEFVDAAEVVEA